MERLKGKTILIGKHAEDGRLSISLNYKGTNKLLLDGDPNSVPNTVSRYKPAENTAHCSIEFSTDGSSMTLMNLNPQNKTFVNGVQIMKKAITRDSVITLGCDNYRLDLNNVFKALEIGLDRIDPKPHSIAHLEQVWEEYDNELKRINAKQIENGKRRLIPIIIGSLSGVAAPILATILGSATLFLTVPIALIALILYIKIYKEPDTSIQDREAAKQKLIQNYTCPKCNHFLGFGDYIILKQNSQCSYCHCKWTTEK